MGHKSVTRAVLAHAHRLHVRNYRPGALPGSLDAPPAETPAPADAAPAQWSLLRYGPDGVLDEQTGIDMDGITAPATPDDGIVWLHVQGVPTAAQLQALGKAFGLHPLALEDVLHHETRPKVEAFETHQFVVLKRFYGDDQNALSVAQVSFFLGRGYLITLDDGPQDVFEMVRQRIHAGGKARAQGVDYLLYSLLDVVVDHGFPLLESLGDHLETLEDEILEDPSAQARNRIHYVKRTLVQMRRLWWPQREVIAALMRDDARFLSETTQLYLRDCYEHAVILIDFVEAYRDMASSLLDTYLSAVNQRMNDIMKGLTVVATIFLPLMFLTGIYGMNFDTESPWNMPELAWRFGYIYVLGLMVAVVAGMLLYFRRKRWL